MRLGIESTNFEQSFKIWGSLHHTWIRAWISFSFEVQSIVRSFCLQMDHKFSIEFKSRELPGHSSTLMWFSFVTFLTCFDVWHGSNLAETHQIQLGTIGSSLEWLFVELLQYIAGSASYLQLGASYQCHKNWNIPKTSFFLRMFYALINVGIANFFVLWSSNMLTSLTLEKHVSFNAENHAPPVFLCPVFVFESPFVAFCLHCFCKELLFNRAVCFSPNLQEAPTNCWGAYFDSFFPQSSFYGVTCLSWIFHTLPYQIGVISVGSFLLRPHLPLRFGVTDPVSFFIFIIRLIVYILTPTIFDISR